MGGFFFETIFSQNFKKKKYLSSKFLNPFFFEYCFHLGLSGQQGAAENVLRPSRISKNFDGREFYQGLHLISSMEP